MNNVAAMLVQHALGMARRTAGVTQAAGVPLVELDPADVAVVTAEPVEEAGIAARPLTIEADEAFDAAELRAQPLDNRRKRRIVKQHPILGVIDDVDDLFIEQPRVDRMQHCTDPGGAVPGGEVMGVIHCQRRDAVALRDTVRGQRLCHAPREEMDARPVGTLVATIGPVRHDLLRAMFARGVVDERGGDQRSVLHRAVEHRFFSPSLSSLPHPNAARAGAGASRTCRTPSTRSSRCTSS